MDVQNNNIQNTSGMGKDAVVPEEIKGWSWGAFLWGWIWGLSNRTYIALLTLVPLVNWVMVFVVGFKGNEWAWRNKKWVSVEEFKQVQRSWAKWGLVLLVILPISLVLLLVIFGGLSGLGELY